MVVAVLGMILSSSVNEILGFIIGFCGLIYMLAFIGKKLERNKKIINLTGETEKPF